MLNYFVHRTVVRALASVFGGYGMFCLYASFWKPWAGMHAMILIGAASAMHYFTEA